MSTPDLHTRAARFFLLAEYVSRMIDWSGRTYWKMLLPVVPDPAAHLPALVAAVRKKRDFGWLTDLAHHPFPVRLSPEILPWYDTLVAAWKVHHGSSLEKRRGAARLALVRLDGCAMPDGMVRPSRLPEWLAEARRMVGAGYEPARTEPAPTGESRTEKLEALAALAAWRPAPGVITDPETLREWVAFWLERHQSRSPLIKGIAARALLNLPEADLRAACLRPVPPEKLLRDLARAIPVAAERTARTWYDRHLLMLDWQPVKGMVGPAAEVAEVARAWLEVTSHNSMFCREMAWRQLIRWEQAGNLAPCGMDLLPMMVRAAQTEEYGWGVWAMARWRPAAEAFTGTEKPDRLDFLRELEAHWQQHRQSRNSLVRASAWLAGIRLHQAGLATDPPESFREAYLTAVAQESDREVLLVLAQWFPGTEAPVVFHRGWRQGWQRRLVDGDKDIWQETAFALLHQALEKADGAALRCMVLEGWRAGTKEATEAYRQLEALVSRFHEVRAHLATGGVPDFKKESVPPAQRQYPRLALPPGHITDRKWRIENEKLRIEN